MESPITQMPVGENRHITMVNGQPVLIGLTARHASSAPNGSRLKAALVMPVTDADGTEHVAPLPFAQAIMGATRPKGWTPEFRLEMN